MGSRTPGPFEASGLAYSSSTAAGASGGGASARQGEARRDVPLVEVDASVFSDEVLSIASEGPAVSSPSRPAAIVAFPVTIRALSVPPSPRVSAPCSHRAGLRWRTITVSVGLASVAALILMGAAWAYARRPVPGQVAVLTSDPIRDALPLADTTAVGPDVPASGATQSTEGPPVRAARTARRSSSRGAVPTDPAIRARSAVLPPPRRASTPTGSPVGIPIAPGQSCGQRCGTSVQCLLDCRPSGSRANVVMGTEPTREQVVLAMDSVHGAVLLCGISLPADAPRTARVTVSFDPGGRASWASVEAPLRNTPVGECIVHAAGRARVPAFVGGPFVVHYPFAVR